MKKYIVLAVLVLAGCTERVPPGYIGIRMTTEGLGNEILAPGNHSIHGRDRLVLVEAKEPTTTEKLKVLCKDDLNFGFDLKIRSRVRIKDVKSLKETLNRQGANIKWDGKVVGILEFKHLYVNYVAPTARAVARRVVSKYQTTAIRENRAVIDKAIAKQVAIAMEGTPVEVTSVLSSNYDYPAVITNAVEAKRKKQIQIEEEEASRAIELAKAENRLLVAIKMKAARAAEGEAEAAYIKITGNALTPKFLQLRRIEADLALYEKVGLGDKVIITGGGSVMPMVDTRGSRPKPAAKK